MEKYTKAQMEVIEFENEDVVTASIPIEKCPYDGGCKIESLYLYSGQWLFERYMG